MRSTNFKKYLIVFTITSAIFFAAIFLSNHLNEKKIEEIKALENKIYINILSSKVKYAILKKLPCQDIDHYILSKELNILARKVSYMEEQFGFNNPRVIKTKKYYSLLQIKDYLLMKKISAKCKTEPIFILYFYSNKKGECPECRKTGYVLTYLREKYPQLRVYAFDFNLDLSALQTLISINRITNNLPALVMNNKVYYGFRNADEIREILPELKKMENENKENLENIKIDSNIE